MVAAVEVKNREELSPQMAAMLRRNLVSHGILPDVPYFILVSQDKGFLWKQRKLIDAASPPDLEFSMKEVIRRYAPPNLEGRLSGSELTLLVFIWLAELSQSREGTTVEPEQTLAQSGFLDAIKGGILTREAA